MTEDEIKHWIADPRRADTLPFGVYEPGYRKGVTGAALVVRGVVYFRNGHTPAVRAALVKCFEQYRAAIDEYFHELEARAGKDPSKHGPLTWFYSEGEAPMTLDKAPKLDSLARIVPADQALVVQMTSADHKLATGFYEFAVFTTAAWQANLNRGMDVLDFTVPRAFLDQRPGVFQALFAACCEALPTVHGHAGLAINVPPMGRAPNEASEYFFSRRYGPGIDVGDPMSVGAVDLVGKIKTVDWIVALNRELVDTCGGATSLALPPDWYVRQPLSDGGLIIQAGIDPQSGVSAGSGQRLLPPVAYVLLNAALRPIIAETMDIIQSGTLDSNAPLLNTNVASEAWLRRFDTSADRILDCWNALHATPKVTESKAVVAANLHRLRKAMGLTDVSVPNGMGYDDGPPR
ncbi:DUF3396 domain-containing protein [Paraburkholderia sp. D15]|uniref:DUF3396 domain-containing protein n=1 Tax=Paraburkholderia sp. D15 TaxID=2880218 RepID=UPI002479A3F9|nr:DUF3396 domain-containing protein [Paraburkholderia sp. D15]WGS50207.1 DUF3396 domain-containing protein [Paraburkholderia sp. D15]